MPGLPTRWRCDKCNCIIENYWGVVEWIAIQPPMDKKSLRSVQPQIFHKSDGCRYDQRSINEQFRGSIGSEDIVFLQTKRGLKTLRQRYDINFKNPSPEFQEIIRRLTVENYDFMTEQERAMVPPVPLDPSTPLYLSEEEYYEILARP